jgi:predicted dehydrogenase
MAVVGVGHLGKEHARILSTFPDVELVGVADVNLAQAEAVGRRIGCPGFGTHWPLLHQAEAAVIAAPTTHHRSIAVDFLNCGIHVLVEKPLAATVKEACELVELARQRQVTLQVGHIERFNPAFEELSRFALQPRFIQCERFGPFTGRSTDIGVVLDLMIHDLDLVLALVQAPATQVESLGVSIFGGHEDVANARLNFENGCVVSVSASRANPTQHRRMHLWAPEGYAGIDFARRHLTLIQPNQDLRRRGLDLHHFNSAGTLAFVRDQWFAKHFDVLQKDCIVKGDQLTRELREFVHCVRSGESPRAGGREGLEAVRLASVVLDCIRTHRWDSGAEAPHGPSHLPVPLAPLFRASAPDLAA